MSYADPELWIVWPFVTLLVMVATILTLIVIYAEMREMRDKIRKLEHRNANRHPILQDPHAGNARRRVE